MIEYSKEGLNSIAKKNLLESNNFIETYERTMFINPSVFKNQTMYLMYDVNNFTPRLERITSNRHIEFSFPQIGIQYSYLNHTSDILKGIPSEDDLKNEYQNSILRSMNEIFSKAKKQINPKNTRSIHGYFYSFSSLIRKDIEIDRVTLQETFGLLLFENIRLEYNEKEAIKTFSFY